MKKTASIRKLRPRHSSRLNGDGLDNKQLLAALMAFKRGDFTVRLPDDWIGFGGKIADAFNDVIATNQRMMVNRAESHREPRSETYWIAGRMQSDRSTI